MMTRGMASHALHAVSAVPRDPWVTILRFSIPQSAIDPIDVTGEGVDFVCPIDTPDAALLAGKLPWLSS
eukprot:14240703-Ditylum_brightwellii.AAC.2